MPKVWVKDPADSTWKPAKRVYINIGGGTGGWTPLRKGFINQSGINKQFYPDSSGSPTVYSVAGTYSYIVPLGITSVNASVIGAGGGGGFPSSGQSGFPYGGGGGGGGAGGVSTNTLAVTPGETLTITVGTGGIAGPGISGTLGASVALVELHQLQDQLLHF